MSKVKDKKGRGSRSSKYSSKLSLDTKLSAIKVKSSSGGAKEATTQIMASRTMRQPTEI
jgi:hypothetical protein